MPLLTEEDKIDVIHYFGKPVNELKYEDFLQIKKTLFAKYHPDKFHKYEDETVNQLMHDQFQKLNSLCEKMESYFNSSQVIAESEVEILKQNAFFSAKGLPFEIITTNKDLKYYLLGTNYRFLRAGDKINIPKTNAYLYVEEDYINHSIGMQESIKLFLTFAETDNIEIIGMWLFLKIKDTSSRLIIDRTLVPVDYDKILLHLMRVTRKQLT